MAERAGRLAPAALACVLLLPGAAAAEGGGIRDVRLYPAVEYTRLVVEGDELPRYRLAILDEPDRLVLDVSSSGGEHLLDVVRDRDLSDSYYLRDIRAARFSNETLRIVFDLKSPVSYSIFTLEPVSDFGSRVVLDISPVESSQSNYELLRDLGFVSPPAQPPGAPQQRPPVLDFVVMIDAGHGGEDPGAVNSDGLKEKHIVLDIARRLKRRLNMIDGITPQLTRTEDIFLPLATRVRLAQNSQADLFISIHADSFTSARPRGSWVFVLSEMGASSKLARQLAQHANLSDRIGGINSSGQGSKQVEAALTGIFRDGKKRASQQYASIALEHLGSINEVHGKDVHAAGFAVLKSPSVPSVLIEVGFISNPADARLLVQEGYRDRLAEQIAAAVVEYRDRQNGTANAS